MSTRRSSSKAAIALAACLTAASASAAPVLVTEEDFEAGATGWLGFGSNSLSPNKTTNLGGPFSTFLGRQGNSLGSEGLRKTYDLPGTQSRVDVTLDFYEIDSWDGRNGSEGWSMFLDGVEVHSFLYDHTRRDLPTASDFTGVFDVVTQVLEPASGNQNLGSGTASWQDQTYRFSFSYATNATQLSLGFGANCDCSDEFWGVDNIRIVAEGIADVPAPASGLLSLLGLGLTSLRARGRRRRSTSRRAA